MLRKVKINNEKVDVIHTTKIPPEKVKGYNLFEELYCNIFLCAKTKSGKTNVIFKILKKCADKNTKLIFFTSTAYNDENMRHIIKYFKKKGNPMKVHTDIIENETDMMKAYLDAFKLANKDEIEEEEKNEQKGLQKIESYILCDPIQEKPKENLPEKKNKPKKIAPEVILIMDDMSDDMRTKSLDKWLKMSRHFKAKTLISSQWINDLDPQARKQLHYCLLFKGHSLEKLETIHKDLSLSIPFDQFIEIYEDATSEMYNFLYIDVKNNMYRQNFDKIYDLAQK